MRRITSTTTLVRSTHVISVPNGAETIMYHALFGHAVGLDHVRVELLEGFATPTTLKAFRKRSGTRAALKDVRALVAASFLVGPRTDERASLRRSIGREIDRTVRGDQLFALSLVLDERCNFRCGYCVVQKLMDASGRTAPLRRMSWETARAAIDAFVVRLRAQRRRDAELHFGGREPLLNWDLLRRSVEYVQSEYTDIAFRFAMNTNGSLVTDERAAFLAEHDVLVTSSLDGPEEANDTVRVHHSGRGTYDEILAGWDRLASRSHPVRDLSVTFTEGTLDRIDGSFFDMLRTRGVQQVTVEPDLVTPPTRPAEEVASQLLRIRAVARERGIRVTGMWEKPFKRMEPSGQPGDRFNCSAFRGLGIAVQPSGDIVVCSSSQTALGHISDIDGMFRSALYRDIVASRAMGAMPSCVGCDIEGLCRGGCYLTEEHDASTGTRAASEYRCTIYRATTRALLLEAAGAE